MIFALFFFTYLIAFCIGKKSGHDEVRNEEIDEFLDSRRRR